MENAERTITRPKPITVYGNPVLRRTCNMVKDDNPSINDKITDLWNTLEISGGVGLAAPQINLSESIFVVKSTLMYDGLDKEEREIYFDGDQGIEETFINAKIIDFSDEIAGDNEGCLSIPGIEEKVDRSWNIVVEYYDADFKAHKKEFSGYTARVIQHEFDHTRGKLYIDHLQPLKRRLLKNKLNKIKKGQVVTNYPIKKNK